MVATYDLASQTPVVFLIKVVSGASDKVQSIVAFCGTDTIFGCCIELNVGSDGLSLYMWLVSLLVVDRHSRHVVRQFS